MSDAVNASAPVAVDPKAPADPKQPQPTGAPGSGPVDGNTMKEAAAEAVRKHKLKVDGEEIEVDENELKRGYSHQRAANKILQEGKTAKKQAEEFISMMKDKGKLFEAIQKLGHDPRKLAEEFLAEQLEEELLDPRDKKLRDAERKLKAIEDMDRKKKEAEDKKVHDSLKAKYAEEYSNQFVDALKQKGLPPTKQMVAEMAKYIGRAATIGFKMTPLEAGQLVRQDVEKAHAALIGDADGETLLKLLGEQVANKVRKYDTGKLKDPTQHLKTPTEQGEPTQRGQPKARMTPREWRKFNGR